MGGIWNRRQRKKEEDEEEVRRERERESIRMRSRKWMRSTPYSDVTVTSISGLRHIFAMQVGKSDVGL